MIDGPRVRRVAMFVHALDDRAVSQLNRVLCAKLVELGVDVALICATRGPQTEATADPPRVAVYDLGAGKRPTAFMIGRLVSLLNKLQPDVLFAHGNGPGRAAILARATGRVSTRVVVVEHTHYGSFYGRRSGVRDVLTRLLYPWADCVAGVSAGVVEDLERRFPGVRGKTTVLPSPGPEPAAVDGAVRDAPIHPWMSLSGDVRVICSVGNLVPRKGQDTLVQALPNIRAEAGDVRLVLVGRFDDPTFVSELRHTSQRLGVSEHLDFAGFRQDVLRFMARSDVFALASHTEGFAMVLVEAMACGVPVVSTDCPIGPRYVLGHGQFGLLVPVADPARMAQAIVRLIHDPTLRRELITRGRERAAEFSPERVAEQYLSLGGTLLFKQSR